MTKWLAVLGNGDWLPERGVRFSPGKHEVSEEIAARARRSRIPRLVVLDAEPEIVWPDDSGPLTLDNLKRGTQSGAAFPEPERPAEAPALVYDGPPAEYHCLYCEISRRSQAALDRHVEFRHQNP